jgi:DNA-directed RNA polymerase III subunit RPC6
MQNGTFRKSVRNAYCICTDLLGVCRIQSLNENESIVYNVIHSTGRNGIWIRPLANRTNLHKSNLDKALKALEGKNFIKSIHNVKFPGRKVYMLAGLMPAEDVTGGAWFTDGVLDAEFIGVLSEYIEHYVSKKSWYEVPISQKQLGKRQTLNKGEPVRPKSESKQYIPYPAGFKYYPTIPEITNEVNKTGITPLRLNEGNIAQLLQMLCFDDKLIALNESQNFKAVRKPNDTSSVWKKREETDNVPTTAKLEAWIGRNGMTEAPCGQCPVFKLCQPGGAVNPDNCEYFDKWLEQALGF